MGAIGGLDVPYGAATQIVRTNVMVIECTTNDITEQLGRNVLDLARQGLPELIAPDFIYFTDDADADIEDVGWSTVGDFQVDTTGNGTNDSTRLETHGCVRDIRQVPLAPGSTGTVSATTALGTVLADPVPGNLHLQAVLSVGAIELTTLDNASPAAAVIAPSILVEATPNTFAVGPSAGVVQGPNADNLMSRAMEISFETDQTAASMGIAGHPAGAVTYLDLCGIGEAMATGFAGTGVNAAAGDLATLATQSGEPGRLQSTDTNLAWDDIDDELANNAGIISIVSMCKVA
jgi:hypothetical protein